MWQAYTDPELVKRWWHANRGDVTVSEIDLQVGGKWRYVMIADGGQEVGHGEYREIVPNERLVSTEVYEGIPQGDGPEQGTLNTATFTEEDGRTTLTILIDAPNQEIRDVIIESGMEAGLQDALDLLSSWRARFADERSHGNHRTSLPVVPCSFLGYGRCKRSSSQTKSSASCAPR